MAVQASDNRFDWCEDLIVARCNYTAEECCNIIKSKLKTFKGADEDFVREINERENKSFVVKKYYFPVYEASYTVTYTWDEVQSSDKGDYTVETTISHTNKEQNVKNFYRSIYSNLSPDTYVGRKDERFYQIAHANDLDGEIYNENCVYTRSQMHNQLWSYTAKGVQPPPAKNSKHLLNTWSCRVFFVPMYAINIQYKGSTYQCVVNGHNGYSHCNYLISQKTIELSKNARKKSISLRAVSAGFCGLSILFAALSFSHLFWLFGLALLVAVSAASFFCIRSGFKLKHDLQYFQNQYGAYGNVGRQAYGKEIKHCVYSVLLFLVCLIVFILNIL